MKDFVKQLFSSESGVSAMRVMGTYSLIIGSILACIGLYKGSDLVGLSALVSVFVGSAFAGKVLQKVQELKSGE